MIKSDIQNHLLVGMSLQLKVSISIYWNKKFPRILVVIFLPFVLRALKNPTQGDAMRGEFLPEVAVRIFFSGDTHTTM